MSATRGYAAARPHPVPDSLEELDGPVQGEVVLPTHLDWGPHRAYHLASLSDSRLLYERVIREALRIEDLREYLNGALLIDLWPTLFLPPRLRTLWERKFAVLSRPRAA
jgi:hypothetical protein